MLTKNSFEKLPVFISSMSRCDAPISSASLALAKVLSLTNKVYYIDFPYSWFDLLKKHNIQPIKHKLLATLLGRNYLIQMQEENVNLFSVIPKFRLPVYSLPQGKLYNAFSNFNNRQLKNLIHRILKKEQIQEYIFINSFNPTFFSSINDFIHPTLNVYHSRDTINSINDRWLTYEDQCVKNYDLSMATSKKLCRDIAGRSGKPVYYFPNGGDTELFKTALEALETPTELVGINTPIIGYTGAICRRIDYELLEKLALDNLDKTIVLVGPREDKKYTKINLDKIPNIIFTGAKKIEQLPAYLKYFDCCIIPFLKNDFTAGIYPLKINEYLGAGNVVVSTNFSEDIDGFKKHIYVANSHQEFLSRINDALLNNTKKKIQERLLVAAENDWNKKTAQFWQLAWTAYQLKNKFSQ